MPHSEILSIESITSFKALHLWTPHYEMLPIGSKHLKAPHLWIPHSEISSFESIPS